MTANTVLLIALCVALPVSLKYLLAFEARRLLDHLKKQELQVQSLAAQWRAQEQERRVVGAAAQRVEGRRRRLQLRRKIAAEELQVVRRLPASQSLSV